MNGLHLEPLRALAEDAIRTYETDGVVRLSGLFGPAWIDLLREGVEQCMAAPGPHAVIGNRTLPGFFFDQVIVKEPGTEQRTPWHQDQPYWAVSGRQVCALWLALDDVAADSSVEFVLGSHRWDVEFNPQHFADGSGYEGTGLPPLPDIEGHRDQYRITSFDVRAGDIVAFSAMTVHGAPGNRSLARRRRAVSTRWCGDDARYLQRPGEVAVPSKDPGLRSGEPLGGPLFPRVWPRP